MAGYLSLVILRGGVSVMARDCYGEETGQEQQKMGKKMPIARVMGGSGGDGGGALFTAHHYCKNF
ncbi:hypothetical protein E2C01_054135 [Portunus trituberculatus]|uniref:Uncharacterized protein n=1 Tax=Portunus trituberculatus TaxID=210409 RepID=A0A5B7GSW8_PORTR|nr:hypothetical protein [Portunus trituberculatus]